MEAELIARENVPFMLQLLGQDISEVVEEYSISYETYSDVVKDLYRSTRQLWVLANPEMQVQGWLITKIQRLTEHDRRLVLDILGGEDLERLLQELPRIEEWALQFGATESLVYSRPGLRKKLNKVGFRHVGDILHKPLGQRMN